VSEWVLLIPDVVSECVDVCIGAGVGCLQYGGVDELGRYVDAVFTCQQLQLQLDTWHHLAHAVLPTLTTMEPTSRSVLSETQQGKN